MKSCVIPSAIAALALLGASPQAEARPHRGHDTSRVYISGYRSCGTPIYMERYLIRYRRCGTPVWACREVPPPVRYYCPPPRRHDYRPPVCPPPYPYYGGYRGSGVVFHGSFRL